MRSLAVALGLLTLGCGGRSSDAHVWPGASAGSAGAGAGSAGAGAGLAGAGGAGTRPWPGPAEVSELDTGDLLRGNVSGATYEPSAAVLWVVANIPGSLHRLIPAADGFLPDTADGWSDGKLLRFPGGSGLADAESVTRGAAADGGLYVASEHDNEAPSLSRQSILRYESTQPGSSLTATHEWDLTAELPPVAANLGIEALTFVPDSFLVERGFFDLPAGKPYDPADYPSNGGGLFFVGVESSGEIFGFALDHRDGSFERLVQLQTPLRGVMSLEHDHETGYLWFGCDDTCGNQLGVLVLEQGSFRLHSTFAHPAQLPDSNNEGIAIGDEASCSAGLKPFFWVDDNALGGVTLRRGSLPCGAFL